MPLTLCLLLFPSPFPSFFCFLHYFFCLFCLFSVTRESGRQEEERAKGEGEKSALFRKGATPKVGRTKKKIRIEWRIRHRRRQLLPQLNENVGSAVSCPEKKKNCTLCLL